MAFKFYKKHNNCDIKICVYEKPGCSGDGICFSALCCDNNNMDEEGKGSQSSNCFKRELSRTEWAVIRGYDDHSLASDDFKEALVEFEGKNDTNSKYYSPVIRYFLLSLNEKLKKKNFNFTECYQKFKMKMSFRVFSGYFEHENDFNDFMTKMIKEKQEKFFKLSRFYNDFIYNPLFQDENTKNLFSLIMIFSLMEAVMSEEEHKTFDQYLLEKEFEPIPDKETLEQKQEEYFEKFGSTRKVKNFFNKNVNCDCKKIFANAICNDFNNKSDKLSEDDKVELNIKLFYTWRSKFVHNAETHGAFQESKLQTMLKNKKEIIFASGYQREDFEQLFEHGFLKYFGYTKKFEHKNTKEKIKRYKDYAVTSVIGKIFENFKKLKLK